MTTLGGGECNDKMEWEDIQFLTFPTIWHQIPNTQGHVTHKVSFWACPVHRK